MRQHWIKRFASGLCAALILAGCARGTIDKQAEPASEQTAERSEIETLNRMVSILIDANTLYHEAANIPDEPGIAEPIRTLATKRDRQRGELQKIIMTLGGKPDTFGEALGTAHRSWTQGRTVMENDTKVAIQEVLRGEYYIIEIIDGCHDVPLSQVSRNWLDALHSDTEADIEILQSLLTDKGFRRFDPN